MWTAVNVFTDSLKIFHLTKRHFFPTQLPSHWSMNILKVLWFRFQQCLGPFSMLLFERSSETEFLHIYLTTVFQARHFGNMSAMRVIFSRKCYKFHLHVKNAEKSWQKVFPFRDNCIWNRCVKLPLLRREYWWPAVNVLKNSPKILPLTMRGFFEFNCLHSDQ